MSVVRLIFRQLRRCDGFHDLSKGISGRRTFLSDAYNCEEAWNRRLSEPVIDKIKFSSYYVELDRRFNNNKKISAIDLDLIAHKITEADHLEELEDLVRRFRRTPNTIHMLPSTPHAVIRSFLQYGQNEALLSMLNNRPSYGIFPDYYCCNLMMDTFLKQQNHRDAAKVAILMMLQEDFDHPVSKLLALLSCLSYLRSPQPDPWNAEPPPPTEEETEDQVIIRLPYLPPVYFDDHFDLKEPNKLLGKTLAMLGREFDNEIGRTSQVLGLAMYEKWDRLETTLDRFLQAGNQQTVFKEGFTSLKERIAKIPDENKIRDSVAEKILPIIDKLDKHIIDGDIVEHVRTRLVDVVGKHETSDIRHQLELYEQWANDRQREVETQVQEYIRAVRIKKLQEMKEELKKKEELLFFFENFEKHALKAEAYDKVAEEVAANKTVEREEAYVPPEVFKRVPTKK